MYILFSDTIRCFPIFTDVAQTIGYFKTGLLLGWQRKLSRGINFGGKEVIIRKAKLSKKLQSINTISFSSPESKYTVAKVRDCKTCSQKKYNISSKNMTEKYVFQELFQTIYLFFAEQF